MLYKVLQCISVKGTRTERGSVIDIDTEYAKSIGQKYLIPLSEVIPEPVERNALEIPDSFETMKRDELVELAQKLGVSSLGKKSDLVERILLLKVNNQ